MSSETHPDAEPSPNASPATTGLSTSPTSLDHESSAFSTSIGRLRVPREAPALTYPLLAIIGSILGEVSLRLFLYFYELDKGPAAPPPHMGLFTGIGLPLIWFGLNMRTTRQTGNRPPASVLTSRGKQIVCVGVFLSMFAVISVFFLLVGAFFWGIANSSLFRWTLVIASCIAIAIFVRSDAEQRRKLLRAQLSVDEMSRLDPLVLRLMQIRYEAAFRAHKLLIPVLIILCIVGNIVAAFPYLVIYLLVATFLFGRALRQSLPGFGLTDGYQTTESLIQAIDPPPHELKAYRFHYIGMTREQISRAERERLLANLIVLPLLRLAGSGLGPVLTPFLAAMNTNRWLQEIPRTDEAEAYWKRGNRWFQLPGLVCIMAYALVYLLLPLFG